MMINPSKLSLPALLTAAAVLTACGGGGGTTSRSGGNTITGTGSNVATLTVNAGPPELASAGGATNTGYIAMNVCVPGTSTCQTVNFVAVDTGSAGIRILNSKLTVALPTEKDNGGSTLAECNQFADGFTWGPVALADITIASTGESAKSIPIQIVDDNNSFTAAPGGCTAASAGNDNSVNGLAAYAIIGIGNFRQDCGPACALATTNRFNPGLYYGCASGNCGVASVPITQQLQNPVALFATDNNGSIIELPAISATGSASVTGSLVFGINTQSNNALSGTQLFLDGSGNLTTTFGVARTNVTGFIDSGSNGLFFLDSSTTGIPACTDAPDFYCPTSTLNLQAINQGTTSAASTVNFSVANADTLPGSSAAFNDLAGKNSGSFDFGLPFFFGRNVYTGLEGVSGGQPTDTGQFVAY